MSSYWLKKTGTKRLPNLKQRRQNLSSGRLTLFKGLVIYKAYIKIIRISHTPLLTAFTEHRMEVCCKKARS
jgi:hypothetical protein